MRYAVIGATVEQVRAAGGWDIKETHAGMIIATLTASQALRLQQAGGTLRPIGEVKADIMTPIMLPVPIAAVPTYSPEYLAWAAGLEQVRRITDPPLYGSGLNLAIIDTGIRETHEKIRGRVVYRKNFTGGPHRDGFDHGTAVASIVLPVAPLANILDFKVLDDRGLGTDEEVVLAIDEAIRLREQGSEFAPHLINLSLGGPDDGDPYNPMRVACRAAIEKGIWVYAAAGNAGPAPGTVMSPACERYVVAVGSTKYEPFVVSNFSGRGPTKEGLTKPDAVFFGEDIEVASSASDTATIAKSGTSFATPFASGFTLLYFEGVLAYGGVRYPEGPPPGLYPELTKLISVQELVDRYLPGLCVKPQGAPATKDYEYGYGMPLGSLVTRMLWPKPAVALESITPLVSAFMMFGLVGTTMRSFVNGRKG